MVKAIFNMKKIILVIIVISLHCIFSCSDTTKTDEKTAGEITQLGWTSFSNSKYEDAKYYFQKAIGMDNSLADAYNGLGWTMAKLDSINVSIDNFLICLEKANANIISEANAGISFDYNVQNEHQKCIDYAENIESEWIFSHNTNIDYNDITLLMAISYYALGHFAESLAKVQILDADFDADITIPQGRAELAQKIEELKK